MRISELEKKNILLGLKKELQSTGAEVYLFGSRTDDSLKGGDIDLLVRVDSVELAMKLRVRLHYMSSAIKSLIGEQKIDLTVKDTQSLSSDPFWASVMRTAVCLGRFSSSTGV